MTAPRIAVDVTPILYGTNFGIGRLTERLVTELLGEERRFEFVLFGRRLLGGSLKKFEGRVAKTVHMRLPRKTERSIRKFDLIDRLCRADLYHATDFYIPLERADLCVTTVHDLIFLLGSEGTVDHCRLRDYAPPFIRRSRGIITISEFSKKEIVRHLDINPEKVHVVYPGVDREKFYPHGDKAALQAELQSGFSIKRPFFLAVSCSMGRKNTPFLIETYATFLRNNPANDLVLVWDPPGELGEKYSQPKYRGRIHFVGRQPDQELRKLYCGATALIFPSIYEGFGLPVIEAMSCGTPVIASRTTSIPEAGGDAAVYVDPLSKDELLAAMEKFEHPDERLQTLVAKGLGQAKKFSWASSARKTLAVYEQCLADL